jgi:NAD(P)-dependent dehydrogenase (short-subunit alcohol dehydrogenase family)
MNLINKNIIITGGNGLIGKSIIEYLMACQANVINIDIAENTLVKCTDYIKCDLTNSTQVDEAINYIFKKYINIDGLVNNAYPRTSDWGNKLEDLSLFSWTKNIEMQLNCMYYITKLVITKMKLQNSGSIINFGSIYGVIGNDFTVYENTSGMTSPPAYSAIKGAIISYTRYLASYLGEYNIRVNTISPGGVFNNQNKNFVKQFEKKVPLKRMANPHDISPSVAFLLSEESRYITGHNLIIDGGWTIV